MIALGIYYLLASVFYASSAAAIALLDGYGAAWFADAFPVIFSKARPAWEIYARLLGVAALAATMGVLLIMGCWIGCVLVTLVSAYEVYLSWTFYRAAASETMQMARITFNSVASGYCVAFLLTVWGLSL